MTFDLAVLEAESTGHKPFSIWELPLHLSENPYCVRIDISALYCADVRIDKHRLNADVLSMLWEHIVTVARLLQKIYSMMTAILESYAFFADNLSLPAAIPSPCHLGLGTFPRLTFRFQTSHHFRPSSAVGASVSS